MHRISHLGKWLANEASASFRFVSVESRLLFSRYSRAPIIIVVVVVAELNPSTDL